MDANKAQNMSSLLTPVPYQLPLLKVTLLKVLTSITSAKCEVVMNNCKFGMRDKTNLNVGSYFILSPNLS